MGSAHKGSSQRGSGGARAALLLAAMLAIAGCDQVWDVFVAVTEDDLFTAIVLDDPEMAALCLEIGSDPNGRSVAGHRPLTAVLSTLRLKANQATLVDMLLAAGADPNLADDNGFLPLDLAARRPDAAIFDRLVASGAVIDGTRVTLSTLFRHAVEAGNRELAARLLDLGADLQPQDNWTPLAAAARKGHIEMVHLLLDAGAPLEATGPATEPPLVAAIQRGSVDAVRILIAAGADLNGGPSADYIPLVTAASNGSEEIVQLLVAAGAMVNATDSMGVSPLHAAVQPGREKIVQFLVWSGADVNISSASFTEDPRSAYATQSRMMIAMMQAQLGATGAQPPGLPTRMVGLRFDAPLAVAVAGGSAEVVKILLEAGANPHIRDVATGGTLLHLAVKSSSVSCLALLLEAGVDPALTDRQGETARDRAIDIYRQDMVAIFDQAKGP